MNLKDIEYFVDKPCTISTLAINWRFNVEPMMDYFVGIVNKIDEHGLLLTSTHTNCKSYIFLKHIVSISEEPVLYEDNPEDKKIIDEYRKQKPITAAKTVIPAAEPKPIVVAPPPPPPPKFVDAQGLANLAKKAKEVYGKK